MAPKTNIQKGSTDFKSAGVKAAPPPKISWSRLRQSEPVRNQGEERGRRRRGKATDFRFCRDRTPPTCLPVSSSSDPTASGSIDVPLPPGEGRRVLDEAPARHPSRKTYGLEESAACNAGCRMDDLLDAGPRRRRRTGESLRHLPLRQGWLGPALHFCASTSRLPMPFTKSERPGSRPRAVPAPLHRADNGRARNEHLPTARPDKHRRPVGRDQPASAEGRQVSQPSAKTVARGYGARHKALRKRWAARWLQASLPAPAAAGDRSRRALGPWACGQRQDPLRGARAPCLQ